MNASLKNCLDFLDHSPSPFHAALEAEKRLLSAGFLKLEEADAWKLKAGGAYFTTRNGSSVIAWTMPEKVTGWRGTLSHSDSPTFRISATKAQDPRFAKARVEEYGGPRYATWMDRPLRAAGRLFVETENGIEPVLVETDAVLAIPTLCCHFDREGRIGSPMNMSQDMQPIFGLAGSDLMDTLKKAAGLKKEVVAGYDVVLALNEKATVIGAKKELFMSPRIDDLAAAVTTLDGFLSAKATKFVANLWCMFDNEEVGSSTRQGAASSFLPDVMRRIEEACSMNAEDSVRAKANAIFLSVDNGHATHPGHPEKSDPEHPVEMNKGIVIKFTANQKYTTNAQTAAVFRAVCEKADVPIQIFYNKPDVIGGGTLGNILSHQVSVPMVDIGLPQLSMHSAMETAGTKDVEYMACGVRAFYDAELMQTADGKWTIR